MKYEMYFLPKWYVKSRKIKAGKRLKPIIGIILIVNIIVTNFVVLNYNKLNFLERKIKENTARYREESEVNSKNKMIDSKIVLYDLIDNFHNYGEFKDIDVNSKNVTFEFIGESGSFLSFIEAIEKSRKFNISHISYLSDVYENNGSKNNGKVNMGEWKIVLIHV
jgi:acetolactate synthase small subunit